MKLTEAEMRMVFQIESTNQNAALNEIYMTWRYAPNQAIKDRAESLLDKLRPLSDQECMDLIRKVQANYRLPEKARTIGEMLAEARQQSGAQKLAGHDITKNLSLKGDRDFGTDKYVGTYSADYKNFSGTEYLFGGTSVERETGKNVTITCTFEVTNGTAQLFWLCGSDDPVILLEGSGEYSETVELPEGGNYFGITGDGLKGSVELTISDAETEAN